MRNARAHNCFVCTFRTIVGRQGTPHVWSDIMFHYVITFITAAPLCALLEVRASAFEIFETEIIAITLIQKRKFEYLG